MQPEQQQRIMGYFIEEAKDHLNTIEQGVLNLQSTIEDQEMVNELFRAAHSVKGGAAMLGLNSIQQVSHRLEDYFKILKESPVKVDQKLEGLFLQVFDALQELVGQLQGPFGLTDETAKATVAGVEPVFDALEKHLNVLASNAAPVAPADASRPNAASSRAVASSAQQDSAFILLFQNDIPLRLREMLQLFKQSELDDANRQQLQNLCRYLISIGEQFDLPHWCALVEMSMAAIAHPDNAYRTLAPIVIKDIKQAQELVLSGRASEIVPCAQLQALQPPTPPAIEIDDFADLLATTDDSDWLTEASTATADDALLFADLDAAAPAIVFSDRFDLDDSLDTASAGLDHADQHGPEVGMAELNSLADLFEGEVPDLGSTWQEEEAVAVPADVRIVSDDNATETDTAADFSDLLFDEAEIGQEAASTSSQDALTDLFSDDLLQPDTLPSELTDDRALPTSHDAQADLDDLFTGLDSADFGIPALTDLSTAPGDDMFDTSSAAQADLDNLLASSSADDWSDLGVTDTSTDQTSDAFDNIFGDLSADAAISSLDLAESDVVGLAFDDAPEFNAPLEALDGLFAMDAEQDLAVSEFQTNLEPQPVELNLDDGDDFFTTGLDEQMFASTPVLVAPEPSIVDPWGEPDSVAADPALSFDEQSVLSLTEDTIDSSPTNPSNFSNRLNDDDLAFEPIEALSEQDDLDFSSLLNATTDEPITNPQSDLGDDLALEELTDDGLVPSIESWLTDDITLADEVVPETLSAEADLESLALPFSSAETPLPQANTVFQPDDFSDPWAIPEAQATSVSDAPTADAFNLEASAFDTLTAEPLMVDDSATDVVSLDFNEFAFNGSGFDTTASTLDSIGLEAELEIDFGEFSSDNALDTNLLDVPDSWLASEQLEPPTDPVEAFGDPFAETPDPIAQSADLFNESLLDRSLDEPDIDVFAFDASSEKEALPIFERILPDIDAFAFNGSDEAFSTSPDDLSMAQPLEPTDDLDDFLDQPNHLDESLELPDDLLTIGVSSEPLVREKADALSDELLGLTDLNSLDSLESIAPSDENLALTDELFGMDGSDESASTAWLEVEPQPDHDALAFDLFSSTDTDATSTDLDAIAMPGVDVAAMPTEATSEANFDDGSLDFDLFESDALDNTVLPESSTAEANLDFGDDLFASNAPEDMVVVPASPPEESLDFGDAFSLDLGDRNEFNGLPTETAGSEDFALDFETSDFDAVAADNTATTDSLFETVPESAPSEESAFDFAWEDSNDDNSVGAPTAAVSSDSEDFALDFETSDFDALGFDAVATDDTAATDSLFETVPESAPSEGSAFDFAWDGNDDNSVGAPTAAVSSESEDFALDFETSDFDALGFDAVAADDTAATDSLFETVPESAPSEGSAFDFAWDGNDDSGTGAPTAAVSSESEDFALDFETSDFDALGFDAVAADDTAATDSLFEAVEAAPSEASAFDFAWDGNDDSGTGDRSGEFDRLMDESGTPASTNNLDEFDDLLGNESQPEVVGELSAFDNLLSGETDAFDDLDSLLEPDNVAEDEFSGLEAFLDQDSSTDALTELDAFLADGSGSDFSTGLPMENAAGAMGSASLMGDFAELESLLQDESFELSDTGAQGSDTAATRASEFDELDDLLKDAEEKMGGSPTLKIARSGAVAQNRRPTRPGRVFSEQTMRVPVKHLDNLSNLVGELVVNRNSLEEDQERLRQSLDNLLYQVQQLSDVGQRMQDLYERSLLESSLLASRQSHRGVFGAPASARESGIFAQTANATGIEYDPLEMDRFTGFHSLSQEMIELIVRVRESSSDIEFIVDETDQVTRMFRQVTTQLQEGLTRSRMVPFAQTADRLPRAVRDIAMKVGKQAELNVEGRETLIDKMILEQLYDPMTHLVNNAITHGIESPEVRRAAGKPPSGRITIRAFHQGNQTIISVSDDGAGIDIDRVKAKAIEKGLITATEARNMARLDVYDLLFHAGFSTKDQADDFSGRGVGMDVVRTSLSEIRGAINTDSTYGKGTTFTIRLPLTLSISKALCCISDRARIAFPMDGVEDMLDVPKERIQTNAEGQACIPWRDSLLPLRPLSELLSYSRHLSRGNVYGGNQEDDIVSIVVLRSAGNFLALQVDQVLGEQEIVIKQLEGPIPKPVGVAGATVLGDGRIMPIADVLELIDLSLGRIRKDVGGSLWEQDGVSMIQEAPIAKTEPTVLIVDDSITVRELLSMTFNKVGYRVEQARDGQEAWEKLRAGLPCDIVFCDIEMPRMDGLELLSRIQKDPNLTHLPIAMLTSRGADRHRQMAVSLGASGYFTKPYLEEALLDAAQRMLKGEVLISNSNA
ncbi:MAG: response regulator [Stenomitos frigidus ULC029]